MRIIKGGGGSVSRARTKYPAISGGGGWEWAVFVALLFQNKVTFLLISPDLWRLKGSKACNKGVFWAYEWLAISIARRQNKMSFSPKVNLDVFLCLNVSLWSRDISRNQKLKMKEFGELVANLLSFDKQIWHFWKRIFNMPNFLRLEWMYAKFKIKGLNNSRLNLGS